MSNTASDWTVELESSVDGCGRFFSIDCGDLTALSNQGRGLPARQYLRDHNSGKYTLIDQQRGIPSNTMLLTISEDEADWVKDMVRGNCITAIRRTNCVTNEVQHFCAVSLSSINTELLTASGVNAQDGVSLLAVPIEYFGLVEFNKEMTFVYEPTDLTQDMFQPFNSLTALAIVGCGCQDCGEDCETVYRYYYVDDNISTLANDFYYLERSRDGGKTWEHVVTEEHRGFGDGIPAYDLDFGFMACKDGRLTIGMNRDNFNAVGGYDAYMWTKEPDCDGWTQVFDEVIGRDFGGALVDYATNGIEAIVRSAPNTSSILIRTIRDRQWMSVHNVGYDLNAISSIGSVIVAGGESGTLVWSTENGAHGTWHQSHTSFAIDGNIIHVESYLPNPLKRREAIAVITTDTGYLYKVKLPKTDTDLACTYDTTELPFDNAIEGLTILSERNFCELDSLETVDAAEETVLISMLDGRFTFWGRRNEGVLYYTHDGGDCKTIQTEGLNITNGVLGNNTLKIYICKNDPSYAIIC